MDAFWSKVDKTDGCWLWTAYRDEKGYGTVGYKAKVWKAHRVSFELTFGEIPDGMHILHSCDNPPCVNPAHLRTGTVRRGASTTIPSPRPTRTSPQTGGATAARASSTPSALTERERLLRNDPRHDRHPGPEI